MTGWSMRVSRWKTAVSAVVHEEVDEGQRGPAAVVGEHEVVGGHGVAPGGADGAASEEIGRWEAHEYLFDDDPLRQVVDDSGEATVRHGYWSSLVLCLNTTMNRRYILGISGRACG